MLSLVATPIGNLEDMTFRAVRTLKEADLIACEDTRTTGVLLRHYDIHTPTISFHAHSWEMKVDKILSALREWKHVALVSDAGTPGISDPGFVLVRAALEAGVAVTPLPGASAVISALICSGLDTHQFLYLGFLPVKKWRHTLLTNLKEKEYTTVIYESTHRLTRTLEDFQEYFGDIHICVGREITKKFEEFFRGSISDAIEWSKRPTTKWEFVIVW